MGDPNHADAFSRVPEHITKMIIDILSPKDTIALSETGIEFHNLTAGKRSADFNSNKIVTEIAKFNSGNEFGLSHRGTPLELVEKWLTLGKTNWVGTLDIAGATEIARAITVNKHPKLTSIDINIYFQQPDFNDVLGLLLSGGGGENIETINIGTNYWPILSTNDDAIQMVAQHCPNLISITVEGSRLHSGSIIDLALKCTLLEHVDLEGTSNEFKLYKGHSTIDDAGIIALAENCKNLRYLDVGGLRRLTDESLIALGKKCPELYWIRLYRWHVKERENGIPYSRVYYGQRGLTALMRGCEHIKISYRGDDID